MKSISNLHRRFRHKTFIVLLLPIILIVGATITPAEVAQAAEGTMACRNDITLSYTGFGANEAISVVVAYSTGQNQTLNLTADGSGAVSTTLPRYSNDTFTVNTEVQADSTTVIGASVTCPTILSETGPLLGDAFVCEPAFYQVLGGGLYRLDQQTFEYDLIGQHTNRFNAIGYNIEDNYIYGLEKINNNRHLIKVDSNGVISDLGLVDVPKATGYRGDFDLNGNLVVTDGSNLYSIDVSATPPTVTVSDRLIKVGDFSLNFHDITYNRVTDTFFTHTYGDIIEIDPVALTIESVADVSHVLNKAPIGAAFSDGNGDLYFSYNKTGVIYYADLNDSGGISDFYPIADGNPNGNNDGASCPEAAAPFEMSCSDGEDNDNDGLFDDSDPDCFDVDGDGIIAIRDLDDDNDGIPDIVEMETATNGGDSDNDGLKDSEDLDSNGNTIFDHLEAGTGASDNDADGRVDGEFGANGLLDALETTPDSGIINYSVVNSETTTPPDFQAMLDSDSDGVPDIADLDDDNDGIPDTLECDFIVNDLPIAVINGSFEYPIISENQDIALNKWGSLPVMALTFGEDDVLGWSTTATDGRIEMWNTGFSNVSSAEGVQHAEINANGVGALYQDISTTPNATMIWSFAHRGRGGADTIQLNIGPASGPLVTVQTMTTDRGGWVVYSGEYEVPPAQTVTRFEYQAVSTGSGNNTVGNFLDDIQFQVKSQVVNCTTDTDTDGIIDALDLDSDGDGLPDVIEAGHGITNYDEEGRLPGEVGDNGLIDAVETDPDSGTFSGTLRDTDDNSLPNFQQFDDFDNDGVLANDIDFDNDGTLNTTECATDACFDDFDGDGVPNQLDLDSDNDGIDDFYELRSASDYVINFWYPTYDADGDGMLSGDVGTNGYMNDFETEDTQNAAYLESSGSTPMDDDNDGSLNSQDLDSNNDGKLDIVDEGLEQFDTDFDGVIDDETDTDFDGIRDVVDGKPTVYGDSIAPSLVVDIEVSSLTIAENDTLEYTAVIRNVGRQDAQNLQMGAKIPGEFSLMNGEDGSWSVTSLTAGSSYTISWQTQVGQIEPNQAYDVSLSVTGEDGLGNAIIKNGQGFNPADIDPDDADVVSLMGNEAPVCETYVRNVAYEDLKNTGWSDWDYNDVVVEVDADICYTPPGLNPLHLTFDELEGTTALDTTGNNNHGILVNAPVWETVPAGGAVSFDGNGLQSVVIGNSAEIEVGENDFAVTYWLNLKEAASRDYRAITHKGFSNLDRTFGMWLLPNSSRLHYTIRTANTQNLSGNTSASLPINEWVHVAYVKNSNSVSIYLDGVLDSSLTLDGEAISNGGPIYIGDTPWYTDAKMSIDDYRVYAGSLTPAALSELISETNPTVDPNTINACRDVTVEAESGALFGFSIVNESGASGGQVVHTENLRIYDAHTTPDASRMMTYTVNIPVNGIYQVYGFAQGLDGQSDSFTLALENEDPMIWDIGRSASFAKYYVKNRNNGNRVVSYELSAGEQEVVIYNREDGSRLDNFTFECIEVIEATETNEVMTPANTFASATITYTLLARGAGYDHALTQNLPFKEGGSYTLDVYDGNGDLLGSTSGTYDPDNHIGLFASTTDGLPPFNSGDPNNTQTNTRPEQTEATKGYKAVLNFVANGAEDYARGQFEPFPWDLYLTVKNINREVHLIQPGRSDNTQLVNGQFDSQTPLLGHNLPLAYIFEDDWTWPIELNGIWSAYPDFVRFIDSGQSQRKTWYQREYATTENLWSGRLIRSFDVPYPVQETVDSRYFAPPVMLDLDGNGTLNLIIGDLLGNKVTVIDTGRNEIWTNTTNGGVRSAAVVEDIDFDGDLEVLVSDEAGYVHAWHHDGRAVTSFPIFVSNSRLLAAPAIIDLDEDGEYEIVQTASDGQLYVYDMQGNLEWRAQLSNTTDTFGSQTVNGSAVVEDIDADGDLEIVVPDISGALLALDHEGNRLWSFGTGDTVTSTPLIADFDPGSPGLEIIFGSNDAYIYILDREGNLIWNYETGWTVRSAPMLFDSDGDGYVEIFMGSDDNKVYAFHYWGELVDGWPQETGGEISSTPTVGDVDGDGEPEILIGGEDGKAYAWEADGSSLYSWPKETGASYKGALVVMNADDDAEEEIFGADFSGDIHIWGLPGENPIIAELIFMPMIDN